jgi:hypothetical protein
VARTLKGADLPSLCLVERSEAYHKPRVDLKCPDWSSKCQSPQGARLPPRRGHQDGDEVVGACAPARIVGNWLSCCISSIRALGGKAASRGVV